MMKKLITSLLLVFMIAPVISQSSFTIEDIWMGKFRPDFLYGFEPYQGHLVTKADFEHGVFSINVYDVFRWKKTETLFSNKNYREIPYAYDYSFSPDLNYILMASEWHPVYRYSAWGKYYLYNRREDKLKALDEDYIQIPTFSPSGDKIVFFKDNNLFYKDLSTGDTTPITRDGKKNEIINGKTDWVYEEEFSFVKAYEWNTNGTYLGFQRFDESQVPEFTMIEYMDALYPQTVTFKYPKAGENNSKVTFHIFHFETGETKQIELGDYEYIPRIFQGRNADEFLVMTMNRHQNLLKLFSVDVRSGKAKLLTQLEDEKYIELENSDHLVFLKDGSFLWPNDTGAYTHIYHYNKNGKLIRQITKGPWDVTNFYGYDPKTKRLFYQSTESGSINRAVYSIDLKGKNKKLLTPANGTSSAEFTKDFKFFIHTYSSVDKPYEFTVRKSTSGEKVKLIKDNSKLLKKVQALDFQPKKFVHFKAADGETDLNAYIIYPADYNPNQKYPVLITQYNGPGSQTVRNSWHSANDFFHQLLVKEGFVIVGVDTRGTGGRGNAFKKITYKQLGKYETEDLQAVGKQLIEQGVADPDRIGIWGWSYGGFMASNAILKANDIFDVAISVAPVTNWRFYDTVYTERYMQTPQENPEGYDENSPLYFAEQLKGKFLLVHGTADDNVHVQNSMRLAKRLQEIDKPFEMMIYPDRNHGIYGGKTRIHLYKLIYSFLIENLKK